MIKLKKYVALLLCIMILGAEGKAAKLPSLAQIITSPIEFNGQEVSVYGYLGHYPFSLYLTRDHFKMGDHASSIRVANLDDNNKVLSDICGGHYAEVIGVVHMRDNVPSKEIYSFYIKEVKKVFIYDQNFNKTQCWPINA